MASQDHGIHSFKEFVLEGSDYFQQTLGRAHTRRSLAHNKRNEEREKKMGATKDQGFTEDTSSDEEYEELNS